MRVDVAAEQVVQSLLGRRKLVLCLKKFVFLIRKLGLHLEGLGLEHNLFGQVLGRDAVQFLVLLDAGLGRLDGVLDLDDGIVGLADVVNNGNALFAYFLRRLFDRELLPVNVDVDLVQGQQRLRGGAKDIRRELARAW